MMDVSRLWVYKALATKNRCTIIELSFGKTERDFLLQELLAWKEELDEMMTGHNISHSQTSSNLSQLIPLALLKLFCLLILQIKMSLLNVSNHKDINFQLYDVHMFHKFTDRDLSILFYFSFWFFAVKSNFRISI